MTVAPTPADPGNIEYCTFRYRAIMAVADDIDPDYDPDWRPIPGIKVTATPSIARAVIADTPFGAVTVVPKPITGITDADGIMRLIKADDQPDTTFDGFRVVAGDNSGMMPSLFTYELRFQGEGVDYTKTVTAPAGHIVDLSLALPVPPSPGVELEAWVAAVSTVEVIRADVDAAAYGVEQALEEVRTAREEVAGVVQQAVSQFEDQVARLEDLQYNHDTQTLSSVNIDAEGALNTFVVSPAKLETYRGRDGGAKQGVVIEPDRIQAQHYGERGYLNFPKNAQGVESGTFATQEWVTAQLAGLQVILVPDAQWPPAADPNPLHIYVRTS